MSVSKGKSKTITLDCNINYDEFIAYYNNCLCAGLINYNGSVTINDFDYKVNGDEIHLSKINIDSSKKPFKLILPSFVTHIDEGVFSECDYLIGICGEGVRYLGAECFRNAQRLKIADFPSLIHISIKAFYYCIALEEINLLNCREIEKSAFNCCSLLKEINAPNLTTCGVEAFSDCVSLKEINLTSLNNLDEAAFYHSSLRVINTPSLVNCGKGAFAKCSLLKEINAPSLTTCGVEAFSGCSLLKEINAPNLTTIGECAFSECSSLEKVNLPSCNDIGFSVFNNCYSLKEVNLPNLTHCGGSAFSYCFSLTKCYLNSITFLQANTFYRCIQLKKVYAPNLIFGIADNKTKNQITTYGAFSFCTAIRELKINIFVGTLNYFHRAFLNCDLTYNKHLEVNEDKYL